MHKLLLFVLLGQAAAYPQPLSFRPPVHFRVGTAPIHIAIADVNKDGIPDIVVANNGSNTLTVFIGTGRGSFKEAKGSPYPAGQSPNDIGLVDFNGDGILDVAMPNHSVKFVTVLLGDGKGAFSFAPGSPFGVTSTPHPHGIAVADFNRDGKLDIAVDSWGENKVLVMFGNGDGSFVTPGVKFDVGQAPYERLRSADFNEDGNPDIITSNWEGSSVSVLLGDGRGGFSLAGGENVPVPGSPFGIAVGDFNDDHHADIAIAHYSGHATDRSKNGLSVLFGDGKGNFERAKGSLFPVGNYPVTVVAGDVNGDGIPDIALPNYEDNTVSIYLGGKSGIKEAPGSPIHVGHGPECVAIGDLNGDGKPDLVVADMKDNEIEILFGK